MNTKIYTRIMYLICKTHITTQRKKKTITNVVQTNHRCFPNIDQSVKQNYQTLDSITGLVLSSALETNFRKSS